MADPLAVGIVLTGGSIVVRGTGRIGQATLLLTGPSVPGVHVSVRLDAQSSCVVTVRVHLCGPMLFAGLTLVKSM